MRSPLVVIKEIAGNIAGKYIPNAIYLLRNGTGFDFFVADMTGQKLHSLNISDQYNRRLMTAEGTVNSAIVEWVGVATAVDGAWSINYSNAKFTKILDIQVSPTTKGNTGKTEDGNFASIHKNTLTVNGCTGKANNAVAAGLLVGTVNVNANCEVFVRVLGTV